MITPLRHPQHHHSAVQMVVTVILLMFSTTILRASAEESVKKTQEDIPHEVLTDALQTLLKDRDVRRVLAMDRPPTEVYLLLSGSETLWPKEYNPVIKKTTVVRLSESEFIEKEFPTRAVGFRVDRCDLATKPGPFDGHLRITVIANGGKGGVQSLGAIFFVEKEKGRFQTSLLILEK